MEDAAQPLLPKRASLRRRTTVMGAVLDLDDESRKPTAEEGARKTGHSSTARWVADEEHRHRPRSWLATILASRSTHPHSVVYRRVVAVLIVVNALCFVLSTVDELKLRYGGLLLAVEAWTSVVFLIEYIARIVVITEKRRFSHPVWGRLRYATTYRGIIDALATFPYFIELLLGVDLPMLTWIRVFRLFRLLRSEKNAKAFQSAFRVFYFNRHILSVAAMICFILTFVTSIMLYYLAPGKDNDTEDDFSSLPSTMFLAILMLAGQGGPVGPLPWYTKFIVLVTSVFSVAMFAIPAGMLTWGFEAEAERLIRREHERKTRSAVAQDENAELDSLSSGDSSWAEYEAVILGSESSQDAAETREFNAILEERFQRMDVDQSGRLSLPEFMEILAQVKSESGMSIARGDSNGVQEDLASLKGEVANLSKKLDDVCGELRRISP